MNRVQIKLACGDYVRHDVRTLDMTVDVACHFHGWQPIEEVHNREWRTVCLSCPYGRWTGQDGGEAERLAERHRRKRRGHDVHAVYDLVTGDGAGEMFAEISRPVLRLVEDSDTLWNTATETG